MDAIRPPEPGEAARHLGALTDELGWHSAQLEWWALQRAAARRWGAERTAFMGAVLREARCTAKPARRSEWERAERAVAGLPEAWRGPFAERLAASRDRGRRARGAVPWSAAYIEAVALALRRWAAFCKETDRSVEPTGAAFDAYAARLLVDERTARTIADYLGRICAGFAGVLDPEAVTEGARFVADEWDRRAKLVGATTKTAAGVVPASAIYDLGFSLMEAGRRRPFWGLHAARDARNGVLLATAASLPQRARALSALDFETTFRMQEWPMIEIHLPGRVLKMREGRKDREAFHKVLENGPLWEALDEYRRHFRPLFDDGGAVFPSVLSRGAAISEGQIGRLVRDLTFKHLGKRVSVHRLRDCVATEASERMPDGAWLTPRLLDHRDRATTDRVYDHAEGLEATHELAAYLATRQGRRVDLIL